jgi:hypothetical protein
MLKFVAKYFAGIHEWTAAPNYVYEYILCGRYGESREGGGQPSFLWFPLMDQNNRASHRSETAHRETSL